MKWNCAATIVVCVSTFLALPSAALDRGDQRILEDIEAVLAENPNSVIAHRDYQLIMEPELGAAQLEAIYNQRIQEQGETPENLYLLSRFKTGEEFRQAGEDLIARYPESALGYWILARYHRRNGEIERAIELYQEALTHPHPDAAPHIYRSWANSARIIDGPEAAIEILDQALAEYPQHLDTMAQRAAMLVLAGRPEEGLEQANAVLVNRMHHLDALRTEGFAYFDQERYYEAAISFETFLRLWPSRTDVWIYLAQAVTAVHGPEAGEVVLEEGLERNPRDPELAAEIARYQNLLEHYDKALEMANVALAVDPNHPEGLSESGHALYFLDRYAEAEDRFRDYLDYDSRAPQVWIMLAEAVREKDGIDAGLQVLSEAMQANPDEQQLNARRRYFESLRDS